MDFEKIKGFILEKKGLVIGIIATILIGGYFIQKNNQPAINNSQVLSENNKNQSTDFSKNKSNNIPSATGVNSPSKQNTVTVDIAGAVKHSGVYTLKNGARLNDLLKVCGGLTDKAETRAINRAALLKDQDQIVLQFKDKNPNGSLEAITSVCDESGLVCAMMPHPERACESILGSTDGLNFFKGFL